MKVGEYDLVNEAGVWFLLDQEDGRIASTLIDMGDGTWRVRAPEGSVRTFTVPDGAPHRALWVAEQVT